MVIVVRLSGNKQVLEVEVAGDDQEKSTAFLAELEGQLRQDLQTEQMLHADVQFYDIRTSVLLGTCPFCGAYIPMEAILSFQRRQFHPVQFSVTQQFSPIEWKMITFFS